MRRRLFLTGPEACGKTRLIEEAVGSDLRRAGGLVLRRDGSRLEVSSPSGWERKGFPRPGAELAEYCAERLAEAARARFAVIDGLGGAELAEPELYEALIRFLFSGTPCVGALERPVNEEGEALRSILAQDPDTMLLETSGRYDINAEGALRHWAAEYAAGPPRKMSTLGTNL